jgi:hypothetical protein
VFPVGVFHFRDHAGFDSCNIQLSDYNFTSVSCEKSASSLTLPNTTKHWRFSQGTPKGTRFVRCTWPPLGPIRDVIFQIRL